MYTDQEIFAEEMAKIYYNTWVYVGHESEIPEPDDYVVKFIGPQSVIMTRGRDGTVHLMQNRCAHRGNLVCAAPKGNASAFRCSYHGWTYSNDGGLVGFPYKKGYAGVLDKSEISLGRLRTASYRGFVFGTFAADGPTLLEHLGNAKDCLDRLVANAPGGEISLSAGWLKHKVKANWKMLLENETDGYHPQFVHASIFQVASSGIGSLYSDNSIAVCRDLGGGHTENDLRPAFRQIDEPMGWFGTTAEKVPGYVQAMQNAHGAEKAREVMIDGTPHVMIFPNLFVAEIQIFVIQPLAVDLTVQHVTCVQFKDGADLNRRLLQQTIGSVGPAGFLLADDSELYERTQRGVAIRTPEWVLLSRGLKREYVDSNGRTVSNNTDETTLRAIWRHYLDVMERP
ncbi:MAG: aromatic ring-hydroxylating oxygenase subunit alpha [Sporichthyaceae bacterium]